MNIEKKNDAFWETKRGWPKPENIETHGQWSVLLYAILSGLLLIITVYATRGI